MVDGFFSDEFHLFLDLGEGDVVDSFFVEKTEARHVAERDDVLGSVALHDVFADGTIELFGDSFFDD